MDNTKTSELIRRELQELYAQMSESPINSFHAAYQEEGMAVARIRLSEKLRRFKDASRLVERCQGGDRILRAMLFDLAGSAIMAIMELDRTNEAPQETAPTFKKTQPGKKFPKQAAPSSVRKEKTPVYVVSPYRASEIIETRKPLGLFITKEGNMYVGIDNLTGDAWTEDFDCPGKCFAWLTAHEDVA